MKNLSLKIVPEPLVDHFMSEQKHFNFYLNQKMIEKAPDYAGKLEEQYVILGYDEHARNGETQECIELYQVFNGKLMHIVDHEEFGF